MNTQLPEHLFISSSDGGLYDTRVANWSKLPPLRPNYQGGKRDIETTSDLKASLRQKYAWPGGYEVVYVTSDGALLCHDCVEKHLRSVLWSIRNRCSDGWRVVGSGYEAVSAECCDSEHISTCDHCGKEFGEIA